jgi:3,4-dihydroxy 2-butanone 4-phosphate synthase/GTP cyclohydrolase II
MSLYLETSTSKEHVLLWMGEWNRADRIPLVRIHSECLTGDVFGSLRCDCGQQLQDAMNAIAKEGFGAILYLRQEGRGIGLAAKMQAYSLQDAGMDTVEANLALGFSADERSFDVAAEMLKAAGVAKVRLLTNNPAKVEALSESGIEVVERVGLAPVLQKENLKYIRTKMEKMRHLISLDIVSDSERHPSEEG